MPQNLAAVLSKIRSEITALAGPHRAVSILAVSKTKPLADIEELLKAGHRCFGENRVQEAARKFSDLRPHYPDLRLHLIGPLQTNKAEMAVELFDVIETLDRPKLAEALAKAIQKTARHIECYIEVNIGQELQKAGVAPQDVKDFIARCRDQYCLPLTGLMCIPPQNKNPTPYFKMLKEMANEAALTNISMGMSGDYHQAIAEGATEIRLGTALFGARE
jgi:PLP dependent protein